MTFATTMKQQLGINSSSGLHHPFAFFTAKSSQEQPEEEEVACCNDGDDDDDDISIASTVMTDVSQLSSSEQSEESDILPATTARSSFKIKKSVRIDESRNEMYENIIVLEDDDDENDMDIDDISDRRWYNGDDYVQFKQSMYFLADTLVQQSEQQRSSFGGLVVKPPAPSSFEGVIMRLYTACMECTVETDDNLIVCPSTARHLHRWVGDNEEHNNASINRHGMERLLIRQLRKDRRERRKNVVRTILEIQEEMTMTQSNNIMDVDSSNNATSDNNNNKAAEELMRLASLRISRPSRLFSRHLAQAQAQQQAAGTSGIGIQ